MRVTVLKRFLDLASPTYRAIEQVRERSAVVRYLAAMLCVGLALALQYSLDPIFHDRIAFTFFITSTLLAAWCGGVGPAVCALVAGFLIADYFFIPPVGSIGKYGKIEWTLLVGNAVPAVVGIFLFELLHRARVRLAARTADLEREVTHRLKAEDELRAAQQKLRDHALDLEFMVHERTGDLNEAVNFLERFCYSIAHDLRAPARALTGFANILEEELPGQVSSEARFALGQIRLSARRMDKLILDLLDYGHISHSPLHIENIPVQAAVASAVDSLGDTIKLTRATVQVGDMPQEVGVDAGLLQRAIGSILANALRFSRPGQPPTVHIRTEERGETVRLWIQDEGIGISPAYREKIFAPFQTLSAFDIEHTGIGLAIVRKCVERLRGRVGVESELGSGAASWIELPLHGSEQRAQSKTDPGTPAWSLAREARRCEVASRLG